MQLTISNSIRSMDAAIVNDSLIATVFEILNVSYEPSTSNVPNSFT